MAKRQMSLKSQIAFIKKQLKGKGIEPDLVDLKALVDPELSYRENYSNIMDSLVSQGKVSAAAQGIIQNPSCKKAKALKQEISEHQSSDHKLQDLKAELKDAKTQCDCSSCSQMGLYDPAPLRDRAIIKNLYDPAVRAFLVSAKPPNSWLEAMLKGIERRSDITRAEGDRIVRDIWKKLPAAKKLAIKKSALQGKIFRYELPLPEDNTTQGTGVVRMVKPFNLVELQANVKTKIYRFLRSSGLFQTMQGRDGERLVKRCKSPQGNVNVFIDNYGG